MQKTFFAARLAATASMSAAFAEGMIFGPSPAKLPKLRCATERALLVSAS